MKRTLSLLLALVMVVTLIPSVFAEAESKPGIDFDEMYYLENYSPIEDEILAGEEKSFAWEATQDGILTYEVPAPFVVTLTQGEASATSADGVVSLTIVAEEEVVIVVLNPSEEAAQLTLVGTLEDPHECAGEAVKENVVDATCTVAGSYESVVYCSVCGEELSRETITVATIPHPYEAVVTAPDCTNGGYTTYTCSACGDSYTGDATAALGHNYAEEAIEGGIKFTCTRCGDNYFVEDEVPEFAIIKQPEDVYDAHYNYNITFSMEAVGAERYLWQRRLVGGSWGNVSGATSPSLTVKLEQGKDYEYRCKAYYTNGTSEWSNVVTCKSASWKFEIVSMSEKTRQVVTGSTVQLVAKATGNSKLNYIWQRKENGKNVTTVAEGIDMYIYTFKAEKDNYKNHTYRCVIKDEQGNRLNSGDIYEFEYTTYPYAKIINQTPAEPATYEPDEQVTFFVQTDKDDVEGITYQWVKSRTQGNWTLMDGETNPTLTVSASPARRWYYLCIIRDEHKNKTVSNVMYYECESNLEIEGITVDKDFIVSKEPVTFTVNTSLDDEEGTKYQWLRKKPGNSWSVMSGKTSRTLTIKASVGDDYIYTCKVTDKFGIALRCQQDVTYTAVDAMTVKTQAVTGGAVAEGDEVIFTFEAAAVKDQAITYQWFRRTPGKSWNTYSGKTATELAITAKAGHNYEYMCKATDEFGNELKSEIVTFTVQ